LEFNKALKYIRFLSLDFSYRYTASAQASLITDGSTSYVDLVGIMKQHEAHVIPKKEIGRILQ